MGTAPLDMHIQHPAEGDRVTALGPGRHDVGVTGIDHIQHPERLHAERQRVAAAGRGRLADGARPEAGTRPIADPVVERDAHDGDVGALVVGGPPRR